MHWYGCSEICEIFLSIVDANDREADNCKFSTLRRVKLLRKFQERTIFFCTTRVEVIYMVLKKKTAMGICKRKYRNLQNDERKSLMHSRTIFHWDKYIIVMI